MRSAEFVLDDSELDEDDFASFVIDEDEFRSPEDFDSFVAWAVDLISYVHAQPTSIIKVLVTDTPVIDEYFV